jgi:glycosyltransferase involved in cell wall biosynthesis
MVPFTDFYVSVSDDIRERAIRDGIGSPDRHVTIRSGFDTQAFRSALVDRAEARDRFGLPHDRVIIGVVGRLFPAKGHDELLRAAPRLVNACPDALLAFAGSGPLHAHLRHIVNQRDLGDAVVFLGRMPVEQMPAVFSAFDLVAHASLREGLARVLPQAVLARRPVVVYDLDGASEVVKDGENGFLVPPRDTESLADGMAKLSVDSSLRERLGGVGANRISAEFAVDRMVDDLDKLYQMLLSERRTHHPHRSTTERRTSR